MKKQWRPFIARKLGGRPCLSGISACSRNFPLRRFLFHALSIALLLAASSCNKKPEFKGYNEDRSDSALPGDTDACAKPSNPKIFQGLKDPEAIPMPAENYENVEGPVWVEDEGALLLSAWVQAKTAKILRCSKTACAEWSPGQIAGTNGLAIDGSKTLYGASQVDGAIVKVFKSKPHERVSGPDRFLMPNDLVIHSNGTLYFTDPDYGSLGKPDPGHEKPKVYVVQKTAAATPTVTVITENLNQPNGITLSLDEKTLYIGSAGSKVIAYSLGADGLPIGPPKDFTDVGGGSDGLTIDCAGNLYVTSGQAVKIYSPQNGELLKTISLEKIGKNATNVAFGGTHKSTLYITTQRNGKQESGGLYFIEMNLPGKAY